MSDPRFNYQLSKSAVVIDVGAFRGDFGRQARSTWDCEVVSFEPVHAFYKKTRAASGEKWSVFNYGLGARTEFVSLTVAEDSSSVFLPCEGDRRIEGVQIRDVLEVWKDLAFEHVDLMKINIEGGEFALLDRMIETGLINYVKFLLVQWHGLGADARGPGPHRDAIRAELAQTHREQWCLNGGQWESWERS